MYTNILLVIIHPFIFMILSIFQILKIFDTLVSETVGCLDTHIHNLVQSDVLCISKQGFWFGFFFLLDFQTLKMSITCFSQTAGKLGTQMDSEVISSVYQNLTAGACLVIFSDKNHFVVLV